MGKERLAPFVAGLRFGGAQVSWKDDNEYAPHYYH